MGLLDIGRIVNCALGSCNNKSSFTGGMGAGMGVGMGAGAGAGTVSGGIGAIILFAVIMIILVLLFAKYLWNVCLVSLVPVKKCTSVWHLVGASILFGLLFP
jgi:hypothetical protein